MAFQREDAIKLSVCIPTQNCATKLVHAIESVVPIADEIVIVDGGSTDNTKELAHAYETVRYFCHPWPDNYALQFNYTMNQATGDWILILGSDEAIGVNMRKRIRKLIRSKRHDCYIFPTYWIIEANPLKYAWSDKLYPDYHQRLFRNLPCYRYIETRKAHMKFSDDVQGVGKKIKDTHIFHFDFIYNDHRTREKKVEERTALAPETEQTSRRAYLFEDYPHKIKNCREKLW
jgi:glycosyltransferase involved in cell wall biosynthesis